MHNIQTITVNDSEMEVFFFLPDGPGPHPGIILAQHIPVGHTGIENDVFTLKAAERYAQNGFAVAVPFIFHWWPKAETIELKREAFYDDWTALDLRALLICSPAGTRWTAPGSASSVIAGAAGSRGWGPAIFPNWRPVPCSMAAG